MYLLNSFRLSYGLRASIILPMDEKSISIKPIAKNEKYLQIKLDFLEISMKLTKKIKSSLANAAVHLLRSFGSNCDSKYERF